MSRLAVSNLRKRYRSRTVVKDVSFDVQGGEVVGLVASDGGEIRLFNGEDQDPGANLTHMPIHRRARLGVSYLPQENSVFRKLSVEENVQAVLELQGLAPAQVQARLTELLAELNTFTRRASNGKFATMNVAVFNPQDRSMSYASAGHPPPFLRRAATGDITQLTSGQGPVLGPVEEVSYAQGYVKVEPGDIVVMYTDGLIERRGQDIEAGMTRAQRLVAQWPADVALAQACRALSQTMAPAPRNDDVCVLALRFGA